MEDTTELKDLVSDMKRKSTKKEEIIEEKPVVQVEVIDDRSAYNCPTCLGEGLEKMGSRKHLLKICTQCLGTGKI